MDEVKLGFIGTGGIARAHMKRLQEVPEAKILAHMDCSEEAAQTAAKEYGGSVYTDHRRMLDEETLDAVYVCVPPHAHGTMEVDCAGRGLHMFIEKPVTLYVEEGLRAKAAIEKAGVITMVGYGPRHSPTGPVLRAMLDQEALGDRKVGAAIVQRWCPLIEGNAWWRRYDQGGGQLAEMTTHHVDLLRYVLGEVKSVQARYGYELARAHEGMTVPDTQVATFVFERGTIASVIGFCLMKGVWKLNVEFWLESTCVRLGKEGIEVEPEGALEIPDLPDDGLSIDARFVKAVATGDRSLLRNDFADGLKSAEIGIAANRSADAGGEVVELPLAGA